MLEQDPHYPLEHARGHHYQLPVALGDPILYPEEDGWYSLVRPLKSTADTPEGVYQDDPEANFDIPPAPVNPARNAHRAPTLIFCEYRKCSGNIGPHSCAPRQFTCLASNCSWPGTFPTKQAFTRHYQSKHLDDRLDCPVEGCSRVGDRGFKRADNLAAHLQTKHGYPCARPSYGN